LLINVRHEVLKNLGCGRSALYSRISKAWVSGFHLSRTDVITTIMHMKEGKNTPFDADAHFEIELKSLHDDQHNLVRAFW